MKNFTFLVVFQLLVFGATAQIDGEPPPITTSEIRINTNRIYGKIVDSKTAKGLDAITVQLYALINDTTGGIQKTAL